MMKLFLITIAAVLGLVYGGLPGIRRCINKNYFASDGIFPKCNKDDPDLAQCIINGIDVARPILLDGIPEISFPSLEPFVLDRIPLNTTITGLKLRGEATNIEASGASKFKITKLNIDVKRGTVDLTVVIPKLVVSADYVSHGTKVLLFTCDSTGKFTGIFNNVKANIKGRAKIDNYGGMEYLRLPNLSVRISFGKGTKMHVEPNEDSRAAKLSAQVLNNANPMTTLGMMKASIDKLAGEIVQEYVNKVLDQLPLQDLVE